MKNFSLVGIIVSLFLLLAGFTCGFFVEKAGNHENVREERRWMPTIKRIGEWAAAMVINNEIQLVVATSPSNPQAPIKSIGYRQNRTLLFQHQDEDGDGNFEKLQFIDPVTGQIHLYFFSSSQGAYRLATAEEKNKRLEEIKTAPGN